MDNEHLSPILNHARFAPTTPSSGHRSCAEQPLPPPASDFHNN